ncbi:MAG: Archaeal ATPase [Ruminococcaceae bacterium]|nr:Archaeal ATPase [Oscillospiraceae bacterium]
MDGSFGNQTDFVEALFGAYLQSGADCCLDMGLVSKWLNGLAKLSPAISTFYSERSSKKELTVTIEDVILPCLSDSAMVAQNVYALLVGDASVSEQKKAELCKRYPCKSAADEAAFLAEVLVFGMVRPFVARDIRKPSLPPAGSLSPLLGDFVTDEGVPKPCRHFCGREKELAVLHEALVENGKVFLHGIPGVGKSEIAKAYAKEYRKEYTNILYFTYTGDLKRDISDLIFADDLPGEDEDERFRKHNRFLRTLREDTLLIVDNFNTTATRDAVLDVVLKYRCRVLFTTRSALPGQCCVLVEEIDDAETLFRLAAKFYADVEANRATVEQIIETVHRHTLAVELAARLLEAGILEPQAVLDKLREEKASFDASDKINISKDGKSRRATYYDHIHTLFALFSLSVPQRSIMTNMTLIPLTGIPARLFGEWMDFDDLNEINELVELGFIQSKPGNRIVLHPMMQEVALSDLPPSITSCRTMLESIRATCQLHGADVPYHQLMFQTVENAIDLAAKDDAAFYLLLLQDVFQYMDNYQYADGMKHIVDELDVLLSDKSVGTPKDRALLLDCRATMAKNPKTAIQLTEDALALLPEVTEDNALLVSNLNANLGALYHNEGRIEDAKHRMEAAIQILERHGLIGYHDSLRQFVNYAVLLNNTGEPERGMDGLRKVERIVREQNPDSGDHAEILETMGAICLSQGEVSQATEHFKRAMSIYETVWADEPNLIGGKVQEIQEMYQMANTTAPPVFPI